MFRLNTSVSLFAGVLAAVAVPWPSAAATTVQVPGTYSLSDNGTALSITNTFADTSTTAKPPAAIGGTGSGERGIGLLGVSPALMGVGIEGQTTGSNSDAVSGLNTSSGYAGLFILNGASTTSTSSGVFVANEGGSKSSGGTYGTAGLFEITNSKNRSPAVSITTNSTDSYALQVVNTGSIDNNVTYPPPLDYGGIAGYFEINSTKAQYGQAAVLGVHSGGEKTSGSNGRYGSAGRFVISNTNNFDSALVGYTKSTQGTGVEGDDFSTGGGVAVFGDSSAGLSGQFQGGSGGGGTCQYDGGSGWECTSDRTLKDHLVVADPETLLDRLEAMPVYYYQMRGSRTGATYLGPMAQDFKAAFGIGSSDRKINTANAQGVALAAAKGLYARLKRDEQKLATQDATIAQLERRLSILESRR